MFNTTLGSSYLCLGLNLTNMSPPLVSTFPLLFKVKAEGNPDFIFVTVNVESLTGYLIS